MGNELRTIYTTPNNIEAHIFKQKLENEGIECILTDEHIVSVNTFYNQAVGGIKVQVKESDYARAMEVIKEEEMIEIHRDSIPCIKCKSEDTYFKRAGILMKLLAILTLGIPIVLRRKEWTCKNCGHIWREKFQFYQFFFGFILLIFTLFFWAAVVHIVKSL